MAAIPQFGKLTVKQDDLFKKQYSYGSLAQAAIIGKSDDFQWKARGKQRKEGVTASTGFEYTYKDTKFTVRKSTEPKFKGTFDFNAKDMVKGLKIKGELNGEVAEGNIARSGNAKLEYNSPEASATLCVTTDPNVKASFTTGKDGMGVGIDGVYDTGAGRLTAYNAAFWLAFGQSTLCLKHESTNKKAYELGKLVNSFHRQLDNAEAAGRVEMNLQTYETTMEFGGAYKPWEDAEVRAKYNSKGDLGLCWGQKLREGLKLTVSSLIDTNKVSSSGLSEYQFGFRFDIDG